MTLRVAVVGAGYWGPNLVRNFRASSDWDLVAVCDLDPGRAARVVGDARGVDVETSLDAAARPRRPRRRRHRHPGEHAPGHRAWPRSSRASTCSSRSRSRVSVAEAAEMVEAARERGLVLMCDHTYCYTPAVQTHPARSSPTATSATSCSSTRSGSTSAWCSRTSTSSGTSRRTTCRSSTSCSPADCRRSGVAAHGADPIGAGHGLRRLPDAAAAQRRHRPRPRQLAEPDQDPADGHRRVAADPRLGRPEPPAAAQRLRPRRRPRPAVAHRRPDRPRRGQRLLPARRHHAPRRCPSARRSGSMVAEFAAASREGRAPLHRRRGRAAGAVGAGGRVAQPRATGAASSTADTATEHGRADDEHSSQGARVLVTGGAGTIGSTIVDQLLDAGVAPRRRPRQPRPRAGPRTSPTALPSRPGRPRRGRHPRPRPRRTT